MKYFNYRIFVLSVFASFLIGCVKPSDKAYNDNVAEIRHAITENEDNSQRIKANAKKLILPASVSAQMMPSASALPGVKDESTSTRFDVSVNNVPAKDFFLGLVNGTGINVVVHPEVSGTISLDLKNVTVDEVLRVTRDIYGYEYKQNRGIYTVYANALRTEVFHINYLDVQRVGVSDTSVLIGRAQSNNNNN